VADAMQKSMSDRWHKETLYQVYLFKALFWKKVFMIHSALLQHTCRKSISFQFCQHHHVVQAHPSIP